jgi:hypothetical protein
VHLDRTARETNRYTSTKEELEELYAWSQSVYTAPPEPDEDIRTTPYSDHSGTLNRDDSNLDYVFQRFIASESPELEEGITLLIHDIPRKFQYQPHIVQMIETLSSIDSVGYIYLPVSVDRPQSDCSKKFWNKGYCFIHFYDANMAQKFMEGLSDYNAMEQMCDSESADKNDPPGNLRAVFAKFQGLSTNLQNLIDVESKKWRPKNNSVYVRTNSGLSNISLLDLRVLAQQHLGGSKGKCNRHGR